MTALAESRPQIAIPPAMLLVGTESDSLDAEKMMERMIGRIFDDEWRGWDWDPDGMLIEVFAAYSTPQRISDLIALGFSMARIHAHRYGAISDCSCTTHRSDQ